MSAPAPLPPAAPASGKPPAPPRDHIRETVDTLVFVVVLVLILQLFVLEAFVIPTGSMAETQYGYQKQVTCEQCRYKFPVNASDEAEDPRMAVTRYACPNCQHNGDIPPSVGLSPGDRVLVHKAMSPDQRGRVVVFKYPVAPQKKQQAQNYIKRCMGFGGETVALAYGKVFVTKALTYPDHPRPSDPTELWRENYFYAGDPAALALFESSKAKGFPAGEGGFELFRKPDELALEMRRIVFDNDHQPADLADRGLPRWAGRENEAAGWTADSPTAPKAFTHAGDRAGWISYRHLTKLRQGDAAPQEVTNVMGYNCSKLSDRAEDLWVGDLMLECTATLDATAAVTLELARGEHGGKYRYQAAFADGKVTLLRLGGNWTPVSRPTPITKPGTYRLRFANVDCRLRVWVNDAAVDFGTEADYFPTPDEFVPFKDEEPKDRNQPPAGRRPPPASVAAKGAVTVSGLKLWRDTHYTPDFGYNKPPQQGVRPRRPDFGQLTTAEIFSTVETYYVQPGHYLCLGDNSAQSSDGRTWGLVPERLMIGRAVFTFWPGYPEWRIGVIR